jgi:hypothetical protein
MPKKAAAKVNAIDLKELAKKIPKASAWSDPKKVVKQNFEAELKEDTKEFKDDKDELAALKVRKAKFKELMDSFDEGLSEQLKAISDEKKLEKLLPKCKAALEIVKRYRARVSEAGGKIGNPAKTTIVLSGALDRIARSLEHQIDVLTDAL